MIQNHYLILKILNKNFLRSKQYYYQQMITIKFKLFILLQRSVMTDIYEC